MSAHEQKPVGSIWFIVVLSVLILACAETQETDSGPPVVTASATISREKGMVGKYFSAKVTVHSNYITDLEYEPWYDHSGENKGKLPPGITFNTSTGMFEGTPTQAGFYTITVHYRDRSKGTHDDPDKSKNLYYYTRFELKIYDVLEEEG
ncbi:MAG: putative Ig domain-containing protein [Planctomycetes bacterium]|nr:putative Ig domain-containing protein [Planctomycetota bacterium]